MSPDSISTLPSNDTRSLAVPGGTVTPSPQSSDLHDTAFEMRHIGPRAHDVEAMLQVLAVDSVEALIDQAVPESIRRRQALDIPEGKTEAILLTDLKAIASKNQIYRSFIGMGYSDCITPPVIQRNVLENPGWYTQYTPYQPEIAQGRLEALLNFQTMVSDLTGLDLANASLLDEGTAAAEAMALSYGVCKRKDANAFFVSDSCHPQTIDVIRTRSQPLGIEVIVGDHRKFAFDTPIFGALLQYPATDGAIYDYRDFVAQVHDQGALATVAADLLALTVLTPPGEFGADIAVGNTQRFGVPLGYGGPHAAYFAIKSAYKRQIPGRLVGVSQDAGGKPALRLALQTREQHIRRDKATSNICTAQVLLAIMASMYAVYHGPGGLRQIAARIHQQTSRLAVGLEQLGYTLGDAPYFDTLRVTFDQNDARGIVERALSHHINLRYIDDCTVGVSLDETTTETDLMYLLQVFGHPQPPMLPGTLSPRSGVLDAFARTSLYLQQPVFNRYHSETELLRYLHRLQAKDLSLVNAMIPLGSCTMKLNATAEMLPVTWPEFAQLHPFAPLDQTQGYQMLFQQLNAMLREITGFDAISLQPNAGSQGEYTGLLVIRQYHRQRGEGHRHICLIPESAHGTNPASAVMAGMKVISVACDRDGNVDVADLVTKAEKHRDHLAALMVTYPSTHGVFEAEICQICAIVHANGGQVYMDGANMNAQVGLCRPGDFGADVCHLNLHKTFCIPHGGGGPGVGPIGVKAHLAPFLPGHSVVSPNDTKSPDTKPLGAVAAAPWGSASILPISWMYIALMGGPGLTRATEIAILNANYIAKRLEGHYDILYKGGHGWVAHECIIDTRPFKKSADVSVNDIAKRLVDYGFHPPTMSWPVIGTMMVEPTESESKVELDRFCDAMIAIRHEIRAIESGEVEQENNLLSNAPHTAQDLMTDGWDRPYSRKQAAYPTTHTEQHKFWPSVSRVDDAYGDRNLVCACPSMDEYSDD
ncbi:MAG: aminomethyl-transferring glycine dehydrogenase [Elainellaceae cyanobacterium]